jgi:catechol 2,3-dioxygenase-like lactoylglutathione lyase family enzyme
MIGTNDLEKAKAFYDALLGTLGVRPARVDGHRIFYFTKTGVFSVSKPINGEPATCANGGTIGFAANSPEQVDKWHAAGIAAGDTRQWRHHRFCGRLSRTGRRLACGGHRQRRQDLRKSARHSRRQRGQTVPRLFARSRRQQDLRNAPDTGIGNS